MDSGDIPFFMVLPESLPPPSHRHRAPLADRTAVITNTRSLNIRATRGQQVQPRVDEVIPDSQEESNTDDESVNMNHRIVKPLIRYESEESSQDQSLPADFDTAEYILTGKSGVPDFRSEAGDSDTGSKQGTESLSAISISSGEDTSAIRRFTSESGSEQGDVEDNEGEEDMYTQAQHICGSSPMTNDFELPGAINPMSPEALTSMPAGAHFWMSARTVQGTSVVSTIHGQGVEAVSNGQLGGASMIPKAAHDVGIQYEVHDKKATPTYETRGIQAGPDYTNQVVQTMALKAAKHNVHVQANLSGEGSLAVRDVGDRAGNSVGQRQAMDSRINATVPVPLRGKEKVVDKGQVQGENKENTGVVVRILNKFLEGDEKVATGMEVSVKQKGNKKRSREGEVLVQHKRKNTGEEYRVMFSY